MPNRIITTENFRHEAKKLLKKYASLAAELLILENELLENPTLGVSLGNNAYKIRLAVKSKGKGKSGGLRVITYIELLFQEGEINQDILLISIYDKSEYETIKQTDLQYLINIAKEENQSE
ncbi:MAG: hypothetical protein EAZ06_08080 [Cytophagales bacterium]|nr:MAG: hypothetical protein EAY69_02935 [Cytophagales bacterium]TAH29054.1 MAG: hypothetical protein EAZ06_08080 [Cytophagales bacterium]